MYYNFTDKDLRSGQRLEEYKRFAQEILGNMEMVAEVEEKLRGLNDTASMTIRVGNLDYKTALNHNIHATGEIYTADRMRQVIYASKRLQNVAVNVQFQEGEGSKEDPYVTVADISFEYNPNEQSINIGEILSTQDLEDIRKGKGKEDDSEEYER